MDYILKMPPRDRIPSEDDLLRLMGAFASQCDDLAQLLDGGLTPEQWREAFETLILNGHRDAYGFGFRRSSGNDPTFDQADEVARAVRDLESYYLQGFENDLKDGKVTDPARRMAMYAGRMRGTANGAWVDGCSGEEQFTWHLGAADHCEDCPILAEGSPYDKSTLWTTPGGNDTQCIINCSCKITRNSDGQAGFDRINVWDSPKS